MLNKHEKEFLINLQKKANEKDIKFQILKCKDETIINKTLTLQLVDNQIQFNINNYEYVGFVNSYECNFDKYNPDDIIGIEFYCEEDDLWYFALKTDDLKCLYPINQLSLHLGFE